MTETAHAWADGDALLLRVKAESPEKIRKIEDIIGSHLERFAFREDLRVVWPENPSVEQGGAEYETTPLNRKRTFSCHLCSGA